MISVPGAGFVRFVLDHGQAEVQEGFVGLAGVVALLAHYC